MSRLDCPVCCTFGCSDQDQESWVTHLLSTGHRINQSVETLWNWSIEQDSRALVVPCPPPDEEGGSENQENQRQAVLPGFGYGEAVLQSIANLTRGGPNILLDYFVDTKSELAVILINNKNSTEWLLENLFPTTAYDPICLKSEYYLRNSKFDRLPKFRLGQPGREENPEDSCLWDVASILQIIKSAPLNLNQQFIYLLENYAATNMDVEVQNAAFDDLKGLLMQGRCLIKNMNLVDGGATHFGYKFDCIDATATIQPLLYRFSELMGLQAAVTTIQKTISDSLIFRNESSSVQTCNNLTLAQSIRLRHADLRILMNLKVSMADDPDVFGPRLFAFLMSFDKRAAPLVNFLQLWNTHRKIGLPNPTILHLVAVFLMRIKAIPSINILQDLHPEGNRKRKIKEGGGDFSICLDAELIEKRFEKLRGVKPNKQVDGFLYDAKNVLCWARNFFKLFKDYKLEANVVCLSIGTIIPRFQFQHQFEPRLPVDLKRKYFNNPSNSSERLDISSVHPVVIQHPFNLSKNVSAGIKLLHVQRFQEACALDVKTISRVLDGKGRPNLVEFFEPPVPEPAIPPPRVIPISYERKRLPSAWYPWMGGGRPLT